MKSLADYSAGAAQGWSYDTMARMIVHDLPRQFMALERNAQRRILEKAPPLTGTAWDALLAAMAEHLAELHNHVVLDGRTRTGASVMSWCWAPSGRSYRSLALRRKGSEREAAV